MTNILLLGGTAEAMTIAKALAAMPQVNAVMSLAGVTKNPEKSPLKTPIKTRVGGFGGADKMADYLGQKAIDIIIDATHPYASQISQNAAAAASKTKIKRIALLRKPWIPLEGDQWREFENWPSLFGAVPHDGRVFMAAGQEAIKALPESPKFEVIARTINKQDSAITSIEGKPADSPETEAALLRRYDISHIICKNSGGYDSASYNKIIAARQIGLPVFMIKRPPPPQPPYCETIDDILLWLEAVIQSP